MWTAIKTVVLSMIILAAIALLPVIWIVLLILFIVAIAYMLVTEGK